MTANQNYRGSFFRSIPVVLTSALFCTLLLMALAPRVAHAQGQRTSFATTVPVAADVQTVPVDSFATASLHVAHASPFENLARNRVFVELLGSGATYSVNYERHLAGRWSGRIGYSQVSSQGDYFGLTTDRDGHVRSIPVTFSYLTGARASGLELGLGATLLWDNSTMETIGALNLDVDPSRRVFGTAIVGYRYQPERQGVLFRVGLTPILWVSDYTLRAFPWGGISVGYAF